MPIVYELDRAARLVRTSCVGDVRFEEVVGHLRELGGLEGLPAGLDVLLDLSALGSLPAGDQIRGVAAEVERLRSRLDFGLWAVAAPDDAVYGMIRMLVVFIEPYVRDIGLFRDVDEAQRWLDSARRPPG